MQPAFMFNRAFHPTCNAHDYHHVLLSSFSVLQTAAHVQFLMARTRVLANFLGFLTEDPSADAERDELKKMLRHDLADLKYQYYTLLYGGVVPSLVSVHVWGGYICQLGWLYLQAWVVTLASQKYQYYTLLYEGVVPSLASVYVVGMHVAGVAALASLGG
jgi:hypothetical protein